MCSSNKRGFTLTEVLIALFVLALGSLFITRIFSMSTYALSRSQMSVWASHLLSDRLAETELANSIQAGGLEAGTTSGNFEGDFKDFAWQVTTLHSLDFSSEAHITVLWSEKGEGRSVKTTVFLPRGE